MIKKLKTWSRFLTDRPLPDGEHTYLGDALDTEKFVPPLSQTSLDVRAGWVLPSNMLSTEFEDREQWAFNQYAWVCLRIDQKKLPQKLYAAEVKSRTKAWCSAANRERAPLSVKTEIAEQVKLDMAPNVLPTTTLVPVMWDHVTGVVYVGTHSPVALDLVRKTFFRTFSLMLTPAEVGCFPQVALDAWFQGDLPTSCAADLMKWVWYRAAETSFLGTTWWLGTKLVLTETSEKSPSLTVKGDNVSTDKGAAAALKANWQVRSMDLCAKADDREYGFTLTPDLRIAQARLPVLIKTGDMAEQLYERMFLIEDLTHHLGLLVQEFVAIRSRPDAWQAYLEVSTPWVEGRT